MACTTSNKAHQQNTIPLLRKPRPPKPVILEHSTTAPSSGRPSKTPLSRNSLTNPLNSRMSGGTNIPITPRPTPFTPTPFTPFREHHHNSYTINPCIEEEEIEDEQARSGFVIHDTHPRGPCFFPPGKIFKSSYPPLYAFLNDTASDAVDAQLQMGVPIDEDFYKDFNIDKHFQDQFTLNDFQLLNDLSSRRVVHTPKSSSGIMMSRQNYLKLTGWFATNVPKQEKLNTVDLEVDHDAPGPRKPQLQALVELQAMVKDVLEMSDPAESETTLSEDDLPRWPTPTPDDVIFRSATSRYFCGEGRTDSPFDSSNQPFISPSEVAILECMMSGGNHLSLKAHFISELPVLSPLTRTLTYLNLSFNNLKTFPVEILDLRELVCLKMRNNPLKEIPNAISNLSKLLVLCVSFNLLSNLPPGLFQLSSLEDLDVSYNTLHMLSRDIRKLINLRKLNVEGNQLVGLPSTAISLPLSNLLVGDNLIHPMLWRENTRNQPQTLVDLCCLAVSRVVENTDDPRLSPQVVTTLQSHSHGLCDECTNITFGPGLRVIRAVGNEKFKVKNLPFIFNVCSPRCRAALKKRHFSDSDYHKEPEKPG